MLCVVFVYLVLGFDCVRGNANLTFPSIPPLHFAQASVDDIAALLGSKDQAVSGVMVGGAYLMQNYAYIAFGVAAVGIHLYGDYASV